MRIVRPNFLYDCWARFLGTKEQIGHLEVLPKSASAIAIAMSPPRPKNEQMDAGEDAYLDGRDKRSVCLSDGFYV